MNEIGYDFAIPGNHEFDYGMDRFLTLNDKLSRGYYSSNLVNTITGKIYCQLTKFSNLMIKNSFNRCYNA